MSTCTTQKKRGHQLLRRRTGCREDGVMQKLTESESIRLGTANNPCFPFFNPSHPSGLRRLLYIRSSTSSDS